MNASGLILKAFGWRVRVSVPNPNKCVICVAPHTSNWDFILGKLAYASIDRKAGFLMKKEWFVWPLGYFFRKIGGIPVRREKSSSLVETIIEKYRHTPYITLAITPEGTRGKVDQWHTGFLRIAMGAHVPLFLAAIDYKRKLIVLEREFKPSGNIDADMHEIKQYYKQFTPKYPEKFSID